MAFIRFGLTVSPFIPGITSAEDLFPRMRDVAEAAEQSGFDSLWVPDHVQLGEVGGTPSGMMPEAYVLLSALAMRTTSAKLGALVSPVTLRNPSHLAKVVSTLDVVSSGRAILGIGAGWDAEEASAYGIAFPCAGEREDRLVEAIRICRLMLTEQAPSFKGEHYSIDEAHNLPRPIQASVPILIGGTGERRTLRVVAELGDACNFLGDAPTLRHKLDVLDRHCADIGRASSEISKTCLLFPPESVAELVEAVGRRFEVGMDGVIVSGRATPESISQWGDALSTAFS